MGPAVCAAGIRRWEFFIKSSITSIGKIKQLNPNDFLIQECLGISEITYIRAKEVLKGNVSDVLIVAPLKTQQGAIYALLVVESLPFLSLNEENIEILKLLLNYFLEGNAVKDAELIVNHYPDCPVVFANELQRLSNLYKTTQHDSAVAAFLIAPCSHQADYMFRLKQEKRGIDMAWAMSHQGNQCLIVIMPLIVRDNIELYRMRINTILEKEFETTLNQDSIKFKVCQVSAFTNPITLIQDLLSIP
jgi:polysaccharide biosynthesis protein PelD